MQQASTKPMTSPTLLSSRMEPRGSATLVHLAPRLIRDWDIPSRLEAGLECVVHPVAPPATPTTKLTVTYRFTLSPSVKPSNFTSSSTLKPLFSPLMHLPSNQLPVQLHSTPTLVVFNPMLKPSPPLTSPTSTHSHHNIHQLQLQQYTNLRTN